MLGIDDNLQLFLAAAEHVGIRNSIDSLERRFDRIFRKLPKRSDVAILRHPVLNARLSFGQLLQPVHHQPFISGGIHLIQNGLEIGVFFDTLVLFSARRHALAEDQPSNGPIRSVRGIDHRLVNIFGIASDLRELGVDFEQRFTHVDTDGKLQRDPPHRVHAFGSHLPHAFDALQLLLLLVDDLFFDFFGAGTGPRRFDRQRGNFHFRRKLHRHREDRQNAEQ